MNYQTITHSLWQWLTPPVFPDKEQTRAAHWLNFLSLMLIALITANSIAIIVGLLDQEDKIQILLINFVGLAVNLAVLVLMRRGYVKEASFILLAILFVLITYINAKVFQSIRTPSIMAYFALIPLAGLLLGRRSMNRVAILSIITIGIIFLCESAGWLVPPTTSRSLLDHLFVLFITVGMNTVLLNASVQRVEETAEEIRQTADALSSANNELQVSQKALQQARTQLEQKVQQRTQELQESNRKLQREVEERQRLLEALATSEANWRSLAEQVPDTIARINSDYTIGFINRTIGNYSPDALIGLPATIIHQQPDDQRRLSERLRTVFQTGETIRYEIEETQEERQTWYINRVGPIWQEGKIVALILIATDITEQKKTEAAMYQMQKLESLGILAGGVAHDFNNLLSVMLMQLSLGLMRLPPEHPVKHNLERTLKAAERATELTRQMLNYAGRAPKEIKELNFNDLIADNIHLFTASISKNIKLTAELATTAPLLMGDKGQLQQLVMNLIINSADAIGSQAGDIHVVTKIQAVTTGDTIQGEWVGGALDAGCYVRLEVHDTGCGMDAETLRKIFDPFFTTKFTGRGLGLASVIGIVRGHKGALHVASTVGRGTTFTILLPLLTDEPSGTAQITAQPFVGDGELVLVIDDEEPVCQGMVDILQAAGLRALHATSGAAGLHLFSEHRHELRLVLLDLAMPGMSGEEVFHQLMAADAHVPILLVSGYSEADVMERFVNEQLAGFVQKPYTAETLLQYVQVHLRKPEFA